jgi:hypothetical protein
MLISNNNFRNTSSIVSLLISMKGNAFVIVENEELKLIANIVGKIKSHHKSKTLCSNLWGNSKLS